MEMLPSGSILHNISASWIRALLLEWHISIRSRGVMAAWESIRERLRMQYNGDAPVQQESL